MEINLRALQSTDLNRIAQLEQELFGVGAWSPALLAEEVTGQGRWYVVAEDATSSRNTPKGHVLVGLPLLVGYAGLWFDGEVTQIMTIGVDPNYQRHGIGKALLESLIEKSIRLEATEVFLEVAVDNQPAINLYRTVGFLPIAIRKRYYQPGNRDAYTMRLTLK